jgi:peptidoglycan/xylan/chitin deacetylase (PgdA/CDA1 family)
MNAHAVLKSAAPAIACYSGIAKALAFRYGGPGVIFMLHSTVGKSDTFLLEDLRCPVTALEWILSWLKDNGFQFVSLDEAMQRLSQPSPRRFCAFTFDDGYADNLTHALPLMERFGAPFTVYVTTGMSIGTIDAWWLGLAALINTHVRIELRDLDCRFDCVDQAAKKQAYVAITKRVHSDYDALPAVKAAIAAASIDSAALAQREALSNAQLRRLAASPLVTVGAHSERHINLARLPAAEAQQEMISSRRSLEHIIDREVVHFAYPFGNANACGQREAQLAQAAGFRTAVTTRRGTLFPRHLDHPFALPREPLRAEETAFSLRCKVDGVYRALHSRIGDPVARM